MAYNGFGRNHRIMALGGFVLFAAMILPTASCSGPADRATAQADPSRSGARESSAAATAECASVAGLGLREDFPEPPRDPRLHVDALSLAGLGGLETLHAKRPERSRIWRRHALGMQEHWRLVRLHAESILRWRSTHAVRPGSAGQAVLYPFSGSDFPNVYAFHPDASVYVLMALEEAGDRPDLERPKDGELDAGLLAMRNTVWGIARNNYLFTRTITRAARNRHMPGVAPTLLAYLAHFGLQPRSLTPVDLDEQGRVIRTGGPGRGLRIAFVRPTGGCSVLYYFQRRLGNDLADPRTSTGAFVAGLQPFHVFLKSAEYVLHNRYGPMDRAAAALRDRSRTIVQDDTGIPARLFDPLQWRCSVFGRYTTFQFGIQGIGRPPRQKELEVLYAAQRPDPLPFLFGYGALRGRGVSNLMYFERR